MRQHFRTVLMMCLWLTTPAWAEWCDLPSDDWVVGESRAIALIELEQVHETRGARPYGVGEHRARALVVRSWPDRGLAGQLIEVRSSAASLQTGERWLVALRDPSKPLELGGSCDWAQQGQPSARRLAQLDAMEARTLKLRAMSEQELLSMFAPITDPARRMAGSGSRSCISLHARRPEGIEIGRPGLVHCVRALIGQEVDWALVETVEDPTQLVALARDPSGALAAWQIDWLGESKEVSTQTLIEKRCARFEVSRFGIHHLCPFP